ncbi:MAG: hypothetical protein ACSLE8_02745 [Rhodococcus sp. (in: high G+C Gram-positive bacteria)]
MRQRGAAWELRVYLGADPVSGKQRSATKSVRGVGKREAQRLLNEMVVSAERGLEARTTTTVGDLLEVRGGQERFLAEDRPPSPRATPSC